jgi:hypothetical protein
MAKQTKKQMQKKETVKWQFPLEKKDMIIIGIGLAVILLGYLLMATGITDEPAIPNGKWNNPFATVIAPILLILGYCVIIPLGLIKFFSKKKNLSENQQ